MKPTVARCCVLSASLWALACEGHQVAVFELPDPLGLAGSSAGSTANAGSDGGGRPGFPTPMAGNSTGGEIIGNGVVPTAGAMGANSPSAGGMPAGSGMGGFGGDITSASAAPCSSQSDCMPGWLCEMDGCQAKTGVCVPYPLFCPAEPVPVCGCDGVTYWNDCIRLRSYARLEAQEQCRASACTCEVGTDCGVPYASCSHLLPSGEMCGHGMGACWVLPPHCEPSADSKMWVECKPPDAGATPGCLTTCDAIATERSYAELHRGDTCN